MKKILLGVLVCLMTSYSVAQAQLKVYTDMGSGAPVMKDAFAGVKGDHFFEDFAEGTIIFSAKDSVDNFRVRLNAYNQTLEYQKQGDLFEFRPKDIKGFVVVENGRKALYTTDYIIPHLKDKAFTKVLMEGEYTLLELKQKVLVDDPGATYGSNVSKAFQSRVSHYIVKDNEVIQFASKKKTLQNIFGEDYDKVKSIERDSNLNLKDVDHLRVVLSLLNERN
jgi:hypothetical protein